MLLPTKGIWLEGGKGLGIFLFIQKKLEMTRAGMQRSQTYGSFGYMLTFGAPWGWNFSC
jgi:hypothetical protein